MALNQERDFSLWEQANIKIWKGHHEISYDIKNNNNFYDNGQLTFAAVTFTKVHRVNAENIG